MIVVCLRWLANTGLAAYSRRGGGFLQTGPVRFVTRSVTGEERRPLETST
jgi:hypothetical protein